MQIKFTFNKIRKAYKKAALLVAGLSLFSGLAFAQTFTNGNLSTGTTTSTGVTVPAGYTWSELQLSNTTYGVAASITAGAGFTVADDFTVPAGGAWNLTTLSVYGYSTGFAGATSPFNDIRIQIYNTNPSVGTPTPIFGDLTTNRFVASSSAAMYRTIETGATNRIIWKIDGAASISLAPGTYWVEWQIGNGGLSNFAPPSTVVGTTTQVGNNALQRTLATNVWAPLLDDGPQDMPFVLAYTTGSCAGTPNPGNTISSVPAVCPATPFSLSLQNATAGSGVTYQWQSAATAAGPFANITGATNSTYSTTLTGDTYFQAIVTCSGNADTSTAVLVTLNPPSACYCIPPSTNCNLGDIITNVTIATLDNSSDCSTGGYANYTVDPSVNIPEIFIGVSNSMSVTVGDGGTEHVSVWIDYNRNGVFETSEFTALGSANDATIDGSIIVPAGLVTGETRMRVRVKWNSALTSTGSCLGYTYGETEDYTVNLQPCVNVALTTQPANATTDCGLNASFTVAASGSLPEFYWEYRASATSPWQNVPSAAPYSGANTATLTVSGATSDLSGYQYRAVFSGACTAVDFSDIATLTVNPMVASVVKTPAGPICLGDIQQLSISNIQPATVLTFNSAPSLGLMIADDASTVGVNNIIAVSGIPAGVVISSIKVKMNVTHSWAGDLIAVVKAANDSIINLAYAMNGTGGAGGTVSFEPTFSSAAVNTYLNTGSGVYNGTFSADGYNSATGDPTIPTGPNGFLPTSTTLTRNNFTNLFNPADDAATLNGDWTLAMYDYYDDFTTSNVFNNWSIEITYTGGYANGVWTSPTPNSLFTDAAATIAYDGVTPVNTLYAMPDATGTTEYSVVVDNGMCVTAAATVGVDVHKGFDAASTSTSSNATACANGDASFTATVPDEAVGVEHQWQVSTDGGATFADIANGGVYSGATTATLSLSGVDDSYNNYQYRDSLFVDACSSTLFSNTATLTITEIPVVVLSASPTTSLAPGITTTLTAAVSPNTASPLIWYRNGVPVDGATGNTLVVNVDQLGEYTVEVDNACGSTSTSSITINSIESDKLFIYPSPNNGQFQVRFFSSVGNNPLPRMLNIYDGKGSRVFTQTYLISAPYSQMNVDLSNYSKGVYTVELTDQMGQRIKTGRVIIE